MDVVMVTKVIRDVGIGRAVQMYSNHLSAPPQIHFVDGEHNLHLTIETQIHV